MISNCRVFDSFNIGLKEVLDQGNDNIETKVALNPSHHVHFHEQQKMKE